MTKKPRVYRESNAQMRFVAWLRDRPDWKVTRIENEGRRTPAQVMRAKKMGMTVGDTDLVLIHRTTVYWVEMKAKGGSVSRDQENVHAELRARKQNVVVLWSYDAAIEWAEGVERANV